MCVQKNYNKQHKLYIIMCLVSSKNKLCYCLFDHVAMKSHGDCNDSKMKRNVYNLTRLTFTKLKRIPNYLCFASSFCIIKNISRTRLPRGQKRIHEILDKKKENILVSFCRSFRYFLVIWIYKYRIFLLSGMFG